MQKVMLFLMGLCLLATPAYSDGEPSNPASSLVKNNTEFALDLYKMLRDDNSNLFFSPYSVSSALAMVYTGAKGSTKDEMAKVLHFPKNDYDLIDGFGIINKAVSKNLNVANSIWVYSGISLLPQFQSIVVKNFASGLHSVDFLKAPDSARVKMNIWVQEQTHDKIVNLLSSRDIEKNTRLVIISAIYMHAAWLHPFNSYATYRGPFHLNEKDSKDVSYMVTTSSFPYLKTANFAVMELPYASEKSNPENHLSMIIFLPDTKEGLAQLESGLTAEKIHDLLNQLQIHEVKVNIPKLFMTGSYDLNGVLKKMGMQEAFTAAADFSDITGSKDLALSKVIHKTFLHLDEKGTEAAAATAATMVLTSIHQTDKPIEFSADRPFMFMIIDRDTESVLFLGRKVVVE